jgi:CheY-like chemotaxis protein
MPDQSGYDVIRTLKLEGRAPELPILVITNYPEPADAQEQLLLSSPLVLEVLAKRSVADRPEVLVERLAAIRRES